jgi:predicted DsbA family dithiol-disulfide isomerase
MKKIKIDIWSDFVCPFCYLGKKKIESAVEKVGIAENVEINYHSFLLEPDFPTEFSESNTEYLANRKNYPIEQIKVMQQQLVENGKTYGINFQFSTSLVFNTVKAHRLMQWAKQFDKSEVLKDAIMYAYFTNGIDLSKEENLLDVIENCGLNREEALQVLNSDQFSQEVENDIYTATQIGIKGVPFFVINDKFAISGSQEDRVFENALKQVLA